MKTKELQQKILSWYKTNGRHDLPWRKQPTPYRVAVAEMMLQQTQVSRVIPKYLEFLKQFPSWKALATAQPLHVLRAWSGLGYNRRALLLQRLAQEVMSDFGGRLPLKYEELLRLPGLGPYTAGAINVFARNLNEVCIDTNVRRVLIHELKLSRDISVQALHAKALSVLPRGRSREWHSALMDYGALVATSRVTGVKSLGKQSKFADSDRFYRGKIVKILLTTKRGKTEQALQKELEIPTKRTQQILKQLEREQMIKKVGGYWRIFA